MGGRDTRTIAATGLLALAAVALAGCGSASHDRQYSVRQVTAAFASQGIRLHKNTNISMRNAYWLASPDRGPYDDPVVIALVLKRPSAGQFGFRQSKGSHGRLRRLGDVRVVWTKKALDTRVEAALGKLGRDSAPAQPKPTPPSSHTQPTSFAQTLAKIPQPLRGAVRRTAAAPSAHVSMTGGEITGSGDYSRVQHIGELYTNAFCVKAAEVIDGTRMYTRGSFPGSKRSPRKWTRQDLSANSSAIVRNNWPRAQLLTFVPPLGMLAAAGHVSNLGRQKIDGVGTTHYQTHLADFRKGLPSFALPSMGDIDVWVDRRDGYIRRAQFDIGVTETVTLSRFGEQVHVKIPPADQTIDVGKTGGTGKLILSSVSSSGGCVKLKP